MNFLKNGFVFLSAFMLFGCAQVPTKTPIQIDTSAVVFTNDSFWNTPKAVMRIAALDKKLLENTSTTQVTVPTGTHRFYVVFRCGERNGEAEIQGELTAGRVYEIYTMQGKEPVFDVILEDVTSTVSGKGTVISVVKDTRGYRGP